MATLSCRGRPGALGAPLPVLLVLLTATLSVSTASELRITTPPRNQTVMNNKRLRLPCKAQGRDPIRIKWFKDGHFMYKIGPNYRISDRSGTLRFSPVMVIDRGQYRCKASNEDATVFSDPAHLHVHAKATIITFPQAKMLRPANILSSLTCEAAGIPLPSIRWKINGTWMDPDRYADYGVVNIDSKTTTEATEKSTMHVRSARSVQVECVASNQHVEGRTVVTKTVDLRVHTVATGLTDVAKSIRWQGVCHVYNGTVCRRQLQDRTVFFNLTHHATVAPDRRDKEEGSIHEAIVGQLLAEMRETGLLTTMEGKMDDYCLRPALELMCHFAFPDCHVSQAGMVTPVPICREHCLAVKQLYCFRQWAEIEDKKIKDIYFKNRAHFRLPDCDTLPSMWDPDQSCTVSDVHQQPEPGEMTDECYMNKGQWYNGTVNVTVSGLACQAWASNSPQDHERSPLVFPELLGAENYCRNPGSEEERPWCYTMLLEKRWEFCDIPQCEIDWSLQMESSLDNRETRFTLIAIVIICVVCAVGIIIITFFITLCVVLVHRRGSSQLGYKAAAKDDLDDAMAQLPDNAAYHQLRITGRLNPKLEGYEFPRNDIIFLRDIGQGAFGRVFKAKVPGSHIKCGRIKQGESALIAVKMLKEDASEDLQMDFEREASLMADFSHANIVQLLGVCAVGKPMCLLFEYMSKGDLNDFLRLCIPENCNLRVPRSRNQMVDLKDTIPVKEETEDVDLAERGTDEGEEELECSSRLSTQEQLYIAQQVAAGMAYLAEKDYVHRDLATRNCLVGNNLVVKISDFGLARSIHSVDYYRGSEHDAIPIRWMPLEAILYNKFSTQSDVWSFGVVMWEIFAFALQPYYGLTHDEVVHYVKEGKVLAQPERTPHQIYEVMKQCWHRAPSSRPSFHSLHRTLEIMCDKYEKCGVKLKEVV